ncbi:RNA polymerase subunit sigma-70 [Pedobacter sp. HMWF019]|uniref:RNA polymerase sigma factor n=1 Tax=Pedobacter sp. HMWF019 TaxID=2056856 RepID=UPI000D3515AD|nr:RNA polymerase sigma-70 factor [Pedobacter sp. HMWF019]PTT00021.1 RNA polymerase subunit sigma-70 [Pedobacter sp. HMWF019]
MNRMYNKLSDAELTALLKEGDEGTFTEVYQQYSPELTAWVSRKVLSLDDAHDLVHDVFIHVWLDKGNVTAVKPYLYYITRNKIVDYFRKNASRREYAILTQLVNQKQEPHMDPVASIEAKDLRENLEAAIEQLPPRTKEIFKLSRQENYSTAEIAAKLGLSEQTVKNQLSTALHYLKNTADRLSILALLYVLYN